MTDEQRKRFIGRYTSPASGCLVCQDSYTRDAGEIKASLQRLEKDIGEARGALIKIPVLVTEHESMKRAIDDHSASILDLRLEHARGKGMLVVIGIIVGIVGSFLSNFFMTRIGGK